VSKRRQKHQQLSKRERARRRWQAQAEAATQRDLDRSLALPFERAQRGQSR
jgi:hypothetical protein